MTPHPTPSGATTPTPSLRGPETLDPVKSGKRWAETVDDAWDPCILTCDGGGIRGYSSLLILSALMHEIYVKEQELERSDPLGEDAVDEKNLLPCHYFDFMYGTSTGGLIAVMLGRLRMTVDEALDKYRLVGDELFGHRRSVMPLATKYHHEPLEKAVQDIVRQQCLQHTDCDGKDDIHPWSTDNTPWSPEEPRVCQSCCLTATHNKSVITAHLLRSYPHFYSDKCPNWITQYNQGADPLTIWQTTRATSAAPFYFELLQARIGDELVNFKDGGIRENNPSGAAWNEFHSLYEGRRAQPALLLSIGTGRSDQSQDGFATAWPGPWGHLPIIRRLIEKISVIPNLLVKYTESEKQHHTMRNYAQGEHTYYKRLNVTTGLERMPLDHWVKGPWKPPGEEKIVEKAKPGGLSLTIMEKETRAYLEREFDPEFDTYNRPRVMLKQTAEKLVRQRRARAKDDEIRWQTFIGKHIERDRKGPTAGAG
ncbi:hypothetical protein MBLNU459_g2722t1 [Dothideomycetes sp. NU459]